MHQFNEHHPELKGFSEYFEQTILPGLRFGEKSRLRAINSLKKTGLGLATVGAVVFIAGIFFGASVAVFLFISGILLISISGTSGNLLSDVESGTKDEIVGGICRYVGWQFNAKPPAPKLKQWAKLKLIPYGYLAGSNNHNRDVKFEDQISGDAHGAAFKSIEAQLTCDTGDSRVTDFKGQLMSITFPRQFLGRTIVLRDKGFLQGKKKGDMKRVGLVDPVFEKIFEAYGTDQVEARYLLTPVFMQTLVDLEKSVGGKNIRFGFDQNQLFIAVETKNQFEAGSMMEPLTAPGRTQKILDEIGAVYDIVDVVSRAKRG